MTIPPAIRTAVAVGVGVAFALLLAWALRVDHLRAVHLSNETRLLAAARTAIAAGQRIEAIAKENADDTDKRTAVTVDGLRAGVLRLPAAGAACATKARDSQGADRPGGNTVGDAAADPDAVIVPRADMLICASNTGRLLEAHRWAIATQALLDGGANQIEAAEATR